MPLVELYTEPGRRPAANEAMRAQPVDRKIVFATMYTTTIRPYQNIKFVALIIAGTQTSGAALKKLAIRSM